MAADLQPEASHQPSAVGHQPLPVVSGLSRTVAADSLESVLGGRWRQCGDASCFVVESRHERSSPHGSTTVGALGDALREAADDVPLLAGVPAWSAVFFFDLETTGLSGGAGTYAFLVGMRRVRRGRRVRDQAIHARAIGGRAGAADIAGGRAVAGWGARQLQRQELRCPARRDALSLPSARLDRGGAAASGYAARRAAALEAWRRGCRRRAVAGRMGIQAARSARSNGSCSVIVVTVTCPVSRFRSGTSTSSGPAIRVRWCPCSSTIASICCRSPR